MTNFKAFEVRPGTDTIVERNERGRVTGRYRVVGKESCATDPGNVHLLVKDVAHNEKSVAGIWCYLKEAPVEIL